MNPAEADELYGWLKGARERLCRAQPRLANRAQIDLLGEAIVLIDRVGVFLPQWSKYEEPDLPEEPR